MIGGCGYKARARKEQALGERRALGLAGQSRVLICVRADYQADLGREGLIPRFSYGGKERAAPFLRNARPPLE